MLLFSLIYFVCLRVARGYTCYGQDGAVLLLSPIAKANQSPSVVRPRIRPPAIRIN